MERVATRERGRRICEVESKRETRAEKQKNAVRDEKRNSKRARGSAASSRMQNTGGGGDGGFYVAGKRKTSADYILDFLHYWVTYAAQTVNRVIYATRDMCARAFIRPENGSACMSIHMDSRAQVVNNYFSLFSLFLCRPERF